MVIEHTFVALKDKWKILKNFLDEVDKAIREASACCILHNFCEMVRLPILIAIPIQNNMDLLVGLDNPIPY